MVGLLAGAGGSAAAADHVTESFVEHVRGSERYDERVKSFLAERWAQRREADDADSFLAEALALLSEGFRGGLAAFEAEEYRRCAEIMGGLGEDLDPYLAANAAVYEIKSLVAAEALEEAEARLAVLLALPARVQEYTVSAAEVYYVKGYCELGNLKYGQASASLATFLEMFPDAPQRLRMTATQMLAELRLRVPERLGDVTDLMDYAARRLGNSDPGQRVQRRQEKAVEILDKLIEDAEQQEQSSSGGGGSSQDSSQSRQRRPSQPQSPMQDSRAPAGRPSPGSEDAGQRRSVQPGEAWGAMRPAEREQIIQALRDRFPDRYRQLVEQYYLELSKEP
jgi:tetratricopeptide (TPR) repeat protein